MKRGKVVNAAFAAAVLAAGIIAVCSPEVRFTADNGGYTVKFLVLEYGFLFASDSCMVVLTEGLKEICGYRFELANDGKDLTEDNWKVCWLPDRAEITVMGEEQEDEVIYLYYNGDAESLSG